MVDTILQKGHQSYTGSLPWKNERPLWRYRHQTFFFLVSKEIDVVQRSPQSYSLLPQWCIKHHDPCYCLQPSIIVISLQPDSQDTVYSKLSIGRPSRMLNCRDGSFRSSVATAFVTSSLWCLEFAATDQSADNANTSATLGVKGSQILPWKDTLLPYKDKFPRHFSLIFMFNLQGTPTFQWHSFCLKKFKTINWVRWRQVTAFSVKYLSQVRWPSTRVIGRMHRRLIRSKQPKSKGERPFQRKFTVHWRVETHLDLVLPKWGYLKHRTRQKHKTTAFECLMKQWRSTTWSSCVCGISTRKTLRYARKTLGGTVKYPNIRYNCISRL